MRRIFTLVVVAALLAAACGGSDDDAGVASLESETTTTAATDDRVSDNEQAVLNFTACLRENGLDVRDPRMDENGNIDLDEFLDIAANVDPDDAEVAVEACSDLLDEISLGFDQIDFTDLQDTLLDFSACMRDNGYDLPDPDFSGLGTLEGDGPFGAIDITDPAFEAAMEQCDSILANISFGSG